MGKKPKKNTKLNTLEYIFMVSGRPSVVRIVSDEGLDTSAEAASLQRAIDTC